MFRAPYLRQRTLQLFATSLEDVFKTMALTHDFSPPYHLPICHTVRPGTPGRGYREGIRYETGLSSSALIEGDVSLRNMIDAKDDASPSVNTFIPDIICLFSQFELSALKTVYRVHCNPFQQFLIKKTHSF